MLDLSLFFFKRNPRSPETLVVRKARAVREALQSAYAQVGAPLEKQHLCAADIAEPWRDLQTDPQSFSG